MLSPRWTSLIFSPLISPFCPSCLSCHLLPLSSSSPPTAPTSPPASADDPGPPWWACSSPRPGPRSAAGPAFWQTADYWKDWLATDALALSQCRCSCARMYLFESVQHFLPLAEVSEEQLQGSRHQRRVVVHGEVGQHPQEHTSTFVVHFQDAVSFAAPQRQNSTHGQRDKSNLSCQSDCFFWNISPAKPCVEALSTYPTPNMASACSPMCCKLMVAVDRQWCFVQTTPGCVNIQLMWRCSTRLCRVWRSLHCAPACSMFVVASASAMG